MSARCVVVNEVIQNAHIAIHCLQELLLAFIHPVLHSLLFSGKLLIYIGFCLFLYRCRELFEITPSLLQGVSD